MTLLCPRCHREYPIRGISTRWRAEHNWNWCENCLRKERLQVLTERLKRLKALPWYLDTKCIGDDDTRAIHSCETGIKTISRKYVGNQ